MLDSRENKKKYRRDEMKTEKIIRARFKQVEKDIKEINKNFGPEEFSQLCFALQHPNDENEIKAVVLAWVLDEYDSPHYPHFLG